MRFGLPRSPSPSPVRGSRTKTKSTTKKRATTPQTKSISAPVKPTYRRGTSFGLRDDTSSSSDSDSSSSDSDDSHIHYPKEYSDDDDQFLYGSASFEHQSSSDPGSSDESFEFSVSTGPTGQRLAKVKKDKGKGKAMAQSMDGRRSNKKHPVKLDESGLPVLHLSLRKSPAKSRQVDETIAAIRSRTRYEDPYEEWEKNVRKEAFRTARKTLSTTQSNLEASHQQLQSQAQQALLSQHQSQMQQVQSQLQAMRLQQDREEARLREELKNRDKQLWERIERVISIEEGKVRAKMEEERKKQEEARKKLEEEERKERERLEKIKAEQERQRKEQEAKEAEIRKKKEEEERARKEEEEEIRKIEEEAKRLEEEKRLKGEKDKREQEARAKLGYRSGDEEWANARLSLLQLKDTVLAPVKADKETKKRFNAVRRQITPKVGQLTNDEEAITRISNQLHSLVQPTPPHPPIIYAALCSSLAKAIILQAETEVTAEKKAAIPLARVAFNLLTSLDGVFREAFWAKLVQRTGGWVIPSVIPFEKDVDGRKWGEGPKGRGRGRGGAGERWLIMGYRRSEKAGAGGGETSNGTGPPKDLETSAEYATRLSGIMRVYWEIVKVQCRYPGKLAFPDGPGCGQRLAPEAQAKGEGQMLQSPYSVSRFWMWFARLSAVRPLLETGVAAELVHTALEVMGAEACDIWGRQWIKVLQLYYEGATTGLYPERGAITAGNDQDKTKKENARLGGSTAEGKAARARVQMEVERIVRGENKSILR